MTNKIQENIPNVAEKESIWMMVETIPYINKIPWIELNDSDMRKKLFQLMEKAWVTNWPIRFSYEPWVVYISFPDYKEALVLRGLPIWSILPDYTWKGKTFELNEQALSKVKIYLERKKVQWTTKTSLADISSDYEATA
jgi:hypothetical protein